MTAVPNPVRIFHITALSNLEAICRARALAAKSRVDCEGIAYTNIAHAGAQGARNSRSVPDPPGGVVHDYVPFYYAPRSPMLFAINGGRVQGCTLTQRDILHLEFTVSDALADGAPFVIYDRNATLPYAAGYTSLDDLDKVAWDLFFEQPQIGGYCQYFHDRPTLPRHADRREKRMAEFLVKERVSLERCIRIGVTDATIQAQAEEIVRRAGLSLPVNVRPEWYF